MTEGQSDFEIDERGHWFYRSYIEYTEPAEIPYELWGQLEKQPREKIKNMLDENFTLKVTKSSKCYYKTVLVDVPRDKLFRVHDKLLKEYNKEPVVRFNLDELLDPRVTSMDFDVGRLIDWEFQADSVPKFVPEDSVHLQELKSFPALPVEPQEKRSEQKSKGSEGSTELQSTTEALSVKASLKEDLVLKLTIEESKVPVEVPLKSSSVLKVEPQEKRSEQKSKGSEGSTEFKSTESTTIKDEASQKEVSVAKILLEESKVLLQEPPLESSVGQVAAQEKRVEPRIKELTEPPELQRDEITLVRPSRKTANLPSVEAVQRSLKSEPLTELPSIEVPRVRPAKITNLPLIKPVERTQKSKPSAQIELPPITVSQVEDSVPKIVPEDTKVHLLELPVKSSSVSQEKRSKSPQRTKGPEKSAQVVWAEAAPVGYSQREPPAPRHPNVRFQVPLKPSPLIPPGPRRFESSQRTQQSEGSTELPWSVAPPIRPRQIPKPSRSKSAQRMPTAKPTRTAQRSQNVQMSQQSEGSTEWPWSVAPGNTKKAPMKEQKPKKTALKQPKKEKSGPVKFLRNVVLRNRTVRFFLPNNRQDE